MYLPPQHEVTDLAVLHALIRSHPLGTWATQSTGGIIINHVPFLLDPSRGPHGTLFGHIARANEAWESFSRTTPSVVVFQGPDAYISPTWYPSKQDHGKAVPTWNYAVVHAQGIPTVHQDPAWLLDHVNRLTDTHERGRPVAWKVSDAPAEFIAQMAQRIVGIEIPIASLCGKWKVSQNRSKADRLGVVAGLLAKGDARSQEMADLVERAIHTETSP
jgi:transcriptional regulator